VIADFWASQSEFALEMLQTAFLRLLQQIQLQAEFAFRYIRCPHTRADYVCETVAIAWKTFFALDRRGKDASTFITTFALRCTQAIKAGRRLAGQESSKDVLAPTAQQRRGFAVASFLSTSTVRGNPWEEALHENHVSPVPEQVCFKVDFPQWRSLHSRRDRNIMDELMVGEHPMTVSRRFGLSPARISQMQREFHIDWASFCADPAEAVA